MTDDADSSPASNTHLLAMFRRLEKRLVALEVKVAAQSITVAPPQRTLQTVMPLKPTVAVKLVRSADAMPQHVSLADAEAATNRAKRRRAHEHERLTIFTDGSASRNGSLDCVAGCGVYAVETEFRWKGRPNGDQSSNRGELQAIVVAAAYGRNTLSVVVWTDSEYAFKSITERSRLHAWVRNGWQLKSGGPVKNQDLWKALWVLIERREEKQLPPIQWNWTASHGKDATQDQAVVNGNAIADRLADNGRYTPQAWPAEAGTPLIDLTSRFQPPTN